MNKKKFIVKKYSKSEIKKLKKGFKELYFIPTFDGVIMAHFKCVLETNKNKAAK
jgi:hypothetical protein